MSQLRVSPSGRITIPAAIRRQLGWGKGTIVEVIQQDDDTWVLREMLTTDKQEDKAAEAAAQTEGLDQ